MADKSGAMVKFVFGLVILAPITVIAGILGLGWIWEYLAGCFFSLLLLRARGTIKGNRLLIHRSR